ncbi:MAG: hypothetical protein GX230_05175 [Lentisphaerae bacterium]|nr:hypothetical protein [Lentisphaerota bacterium]
MIDKTPLGVPVFDTLFGGIFRNCQTLCCGRHKSGKSILGIHFLNQGLSEGDRALLLTERFASDTIILSQSLGMPLGEAAKSGQLTILEYTSLITEQAASTNMMLPPEAFMELQEVISSQAINRVVIDSVLPWVAIEPVTRLNEHLLSFIRALDRLEATVLLTLPKPASSAAFMLKNRLKHLCPVSILLDVNSNGDRTLKVTKYLGEATHIDKSLPFTIRSGVGFTALPASTYNNNTTRTDSATPHPAATVPEQAIKRPISFSSVIKTP